MASRAALSLDGTVASWLQIHPLMTPYARGAPTHLAAQALKSGGESRRTDVFDVPCSCLKSGRAQSQPTSSSPRPFLLRAALSAYVARCASFILSSNPGSRLPPRSKAACNADDLRCWRVGPPPTLYL